MIEFKSFGKIARLSREIVITEKIDGTNAQIHIEDDGVTMHVGSRNRYIDVGDDNFGFAAWARANQDELLTLGPGRHFGEWWGAGIQRRYGLTGSDKRFSLFNVSRWGEVRPACCGVVPVLYRGPFSEEAIEQALEDLRIGGSCAAPGFDKPEGIIVLHTAANVFFKKTLEGDDAPKSSIAA